MWHIVGDGRQLEHPEWSDCRFRSSCAANDIVISTTRDGTTWTAPKRVPIAFNTSAADHFAPGIGVDPASWDAATRIGLTYAYYPDASCTFSTCPLNVGCISSTTPARRGARHPDQPAP